MPMYHATDYPFQPGDIVDPAFSKKGKVYATSNINFAMTAAKERYKYRNRKLLSDGRELAATEVPTIHMFEVVPIDPTEPIHQKDDRPGVYASTVGFRVIRKLDLKDPQLLTFDEIIQGPQPQTRRERIDMERFVKVDGPTHLWPAIVVLAGEVLIVAAVTAFITFWFVM